MRADIRSISNAYKALLLLSYSYTFICVYIYICKCVSWKAIGYSAIIKNYQFNILSQN